MKGFFIVPFFFFLLFSAIGVMFLLTLNNANCSGNILNS